VVERRIRFLAQPYGFADAALWLVRNVFGPSRRHRSLTPFMRRGARLNRIVPAATIVFIGDIMPCRGITLDYTPGLRSFIADADYLVGNFEGTILTKKAPPVLFGQAHAISILDSLASLFPPEKTILSCANNHTADYGWAHFRESYRLLERFGFRPIGRKDNPRVLLDGAINIAACTQWSNQACDYIARVEQADSLIDSSAKFNIMFPCWGTEMCLYPSPSQIEAAAEMLHRWDMIVGHHSHCPQPVTAAAAAKKRKLIAYSLGNFVFGVNLSQYLRGLAVKVRIGPGRGGWRVGEVDWRFIQVRFVSNSRARVRASRRCDLFRDAAVS
jgi:Bacterial capsule synthesis protein PGA_cap